MAYAKEVVAADFEEAGDDDVLRKVLGDFAAKNVAITEPAIRAKMNELIAVAAAEVKAGNKYPYYATGRRADFLRAGRFILERGLRAAP